MARKQQKKSAIGRPAIVTGRSAGAVVTVRITPEATRMLDKHRGGKSIGDAIDILVNRKATTMRMPGIERRRGRWPQMRFAGRTERLSCRLGPATVMKLDRACARLEANRPDVIEVLIREFARELKEW